MATRGWHRIVSGSYRYTNAQGRTLAYVQENGGAWSATVLPMADAAQSVTLSERPATFRESKGLAERAYLSLTRSAIVRQREALALHGH